MDPAGFFRLVILKHSANQFKESLPANQAAAVDIIFTVDELGVNPAEFGNLANHTTLWKS